MMNSQKQNLGALKIEMLRQVAQQRQMIAPLIIDEDQKEFFKDGFRQKRLI